MLPDFARGAGIIEVGCPNLVAVAGVREPLYGAFVVKNVFRGV
jgi:hypothetical protein